MFAEPRTGQVLTVASGVDGRRFVAFNAFLVLLVRRGWCYYFNASDVLNIRRNHG
jgi:hypothetical protein